jgi:hypothetical protein
MHIGKRAIVIGAGMGELSAARALIGSGKWATSNKTNAYA